MRLFILLIFSVFPALAFSQKAEQGLVPSETEQSQEWVLVLDDPRPSRLQGWVRNGYGKTTSDYRGALELERFGKKIADNYDMELRDQWFIPSLGVYCLVVRFNNDQEETIALLKKNKSVQWVQPSNDFELLSTSSLPQSDSSNYNKDYKEDYQSNIINSNVPNDADGAGVIIAIVDSAVDDSHQDLTGSISQVGDFVVAGASNSVGEAHGTAIAGVIVADRNSTLGVAGVAPAATLQVYRGCWESNETEKTNCNTLSLARALDAVLRSQADILNLSLSGPKDALLDRLLQRVLDRGTLVVTAFDPLRDQANRFPSEREGVVVVRATGLDEDKRVFFTAPGARVVPLPGNRYDFMHGHSVATAYTSGVLALRKQAVDTNRFAKANKVDWRNISHDGKASDLLVEIFGKS